MNASPSPSSLTDRIQRLLDERQQHADALADIEQTLEQIQRVLDGTPTPTAKPRPTPAPLSEPAKGGSRRRRYPISAPESILAFIRQKGGATAREIREHWQSNGRPGNGSPVLARLASSGKVKRASIPGQRGGRYTIAGRASRSAPAPKASASPIAGSARTTGISGPEFVLQFVGEQKNATTAEIEAGWKAAGRPGRANKTLGRLVEVGKLKRESIKGGQGSRYSLA